jgi:hypothetical protein
MTEGLKKLALILLIPVAVTLVYDLIDGWFVHATFALDNVDKWWKRAGLPGPWEEKLRVLMDQTIGTGRTDKIFKAPAAFVLAVPPMFFYVLYRIIFLLQGGKQGGYKSRY